MFLNFEVLHDITPPLTSPILCSATLKPEALHDISLPLTVPIMFGYSATCSLDSSHNGHLD